MDTIRNYLENMFKVLPQTKEVLDMKSELLGHMTDKYNELKASGKTENEAVGIVISEFGNIDELLEEMGIDTRQSHEETENLPLVELEEANEYVRIKKANGIRVGFGVFLILLGTSIMLLLGGVGELRFQGGRGEDVFDVFGICILLFCVAIAVAIFIYSGSLEEKFKYLEGKFQASTGVVAEMTSRYSAFMPTYTLSTVIGVTLIIIGTIPLLASSIFEDTQMGDMISIVCLCFLICLVGISVFIFIYFGNQKEAYTRLLQTGDYSLERKEDDKLVAAVGAVVWPITVVCFLVWGFFFGGWGISWILFPIVGILFGAFSAVVNIIKHGTK